MLVRYYMSQGRDVILFIMSFLILGCDAQISQFVGMRSRFTPDDRILDPSSPPPSGSTPVPYAKLLTEIGTEPSTILGTTSFKSFASVGGKYLFVGSDLEHGRELWILDPVTQQAQFLKDLYPGPYSSSPRQFTLSQGLVYFLAADANGIIQLWVSDGTVVGTQAVTSFTTNFEYDYGLISPTTFGVFFSKNDAVYNSILWRSDGTVAGTYKVKDVQCGSGPVLLGGFYYFAGDDFSGGGTELWKTDGTAAGTTLVADLEAGFGSNPIYLNVVGSKLIFRAMTMATGAEMFYHDPAGPTTALLIDTRAGASSGNPNQSVVSGGKAYFISRAASGFYYIYVTDGTPGGSGMLDSNISLPSGSSTEFKIAGTRLFVFGYDGAQNGLIAFDLSSSGYTVLYPGSTGMNVNFLTSLGGFAYVPVYQAADGVEIRKINLTTLATSNVKDINPSTANISVNVPTPFSSGLIPFDATRFVFLVDDGTNGSELWISDGTNAGTNMIKDISSGTASTAVGIYLQDAANSRFYFLAKPVGSPAQVWVTDGTSSGTQVVTNSPRTYGGPDTFYNGRNIKAVLGDKILFAGGVDNVAMVSAFDTITSTTTHFTGTRNPSSGLSIYHLYSFYTFAQKLFFNLNTTTSAATETLGSSDGTSANSGVFLDPNPTDAASITEIRFLGESPTHLFFTASDTNGRELWKTDGTVVGTSMVKDITAGAANSAFGAIGFYLNSNFVFASMDANGYELWKTDGTSGNTSLLKDINIGAGSSLGVSTKGLIAGNLFFFPATDNTADTELWKSDGTSAGTVLVKNINPTGSSNPNIVSAFGNSVLFTATDGVNGVEWWISDGTSAGTVMLKNIAAGAAGISTTYQPIIIFGTGANRRAIFWADDGVVGNEPWITDGTPAGTMLFKDINPGAGSSANAGSSPTNASIGNMIYFVADDGVHGPEIWRSDGTSAGTSLYFETYAGEPHSSIGSLTAVNGVLYFLGNSPHGNREFYKVDMQ